LLHVAAVCCLLLLTAAAAAHGCCCCCVVSQVRREVRGQSGASGRLAALEDKLAVLEGAVVGAGERRGGGGAGGATGTWPLLSTAE